MNEGGRKQEEKIHEGIKTRNRKTKKNGESKRQTCSQVDSWNRKFLAAPEATGRISDSFQKLLKRAAIARWPTL